MPIVPFKTPLDYWTDVLLCNPDNINKLPTMEKPDWWRHMDCDLHIYPYDHAQPALLSMGCFNRCSFCPTAKHFQGNVYFGDPEIILPYYGGATVHFMDEDFFRNDMAVVLPLLDKLGIIWTAMSTFDSFAEVLSKYGDGMLYHYGLRCVEIGLENVDLMMKVKHDITTKMVEVYYLNMTCLPGETKQTIRNNREWMKDRSLKRPIHFNNGLWYAPGQFYYPYDTVRTDGIMLPSKYARTRPTYIPDTLLSEDFFLFNMEKVNYYCQLVYGFKMYPKQTTGTIGEFIGADPLQALWLLEGLRCGGIE